MMDKSSFSDPVVISLTQEIFKELCKNEACIGPVQHRLLPTLISILNAQPDKVPLGIQSVKMKLEHFIMH